MLVDPSNQTAGSAVTGAIRQAAQATGTSFQYLLATAQVESGLNPQRRRGDLVGARPVPVHRSDLARHHQAIGRGLGLWPIADAITQTASGHYEVTRSGDAQRNSQAPQRSGGKRHDGRRLHAGQRRGAFGKARPLPQRRRALHRPFHGGRAAPRDSSHPRPPIPPAARRAIFRSPPEPIPRSSTTVRPGSRAPLAEVRNLLTARYDVAARSRPSVNAVAQADLPPSAASRAVSRSASPVASAAMPYRAQTAIPLSHPVRTIPIFSASASVPATTGHAGCCCSSRHRRHDQRLRRRRAGGARRAGERYISTGYFPIQAAAVRSPSVVSQLWGVANTPAAAGTDGSATPSGGTLLDLFKDNQRGT